MAGCSTDSEEAVFVFKGEHVKVPEFKSSYLTWLNSEGYGDSQKMRESFLFTWVIDEIMYDKGVQEGIEYLPDIAKKIEEYKKELIIKTMKKKIEEEVFSMSDEKIKNYYMEHKKDFLREKLYRLSAVRVKTKKKADKVMEMLKNGDFRIGILSARYSDDKNLASNNGDYGLFSDDIMDSVWRDSVINGDIGDALGPFRDSEGYYTILEISGFAYKRELSFKRAYHLIVKQMMESQDKEKWSEYRKKLIRNYGVKINLDKLNWE